jgi:hypothetical protein
MAFYLTPISPMSPELPSVRGFNIDSIFRGERLSFLRAVFFVLLSCSSFSSASLQVSIPEGSPLVPLDMPEDEYGFSQVFSGNIRVTGTFNAQWTKSTAVNANGKKMLKPILSVAFRPDQQSKKYLPLYSSQLDIKELWLFPADEVVKKLFSASKERRIILSRKKLVSGEADLLLSAYRIEVTCDTVTYSATVATVFQSIDMQFTSVKAPVRTSEGC